VQHPQEEGTAQEQGPLQHLKHGIAHAADAVCGKAAQALGVAEVPPEAPAVIEVARREQQGGSSSSSSSSSSSRERHELKGSGSGSCGSEGSCGSCGVAVAEGASKSESEQEGSGSKSHELKGGTSKSESEQEGSGSKSHELKGGTSKSAEQEGSDSVGQEASVPSAVLSSLLSASSAPSSGWWCGLPQERLNEQGGIQGLFAAMTREVGLSDCTRSRGSSLLASVLK